MRLASFFYTVPQMEEEIKSVTRRMGWWWLLQKDLVNEQVIVLAVQKSQGRKKGEPIVPIYPIRILSARKEPLNRMITDVRYGYDEVIKEGFPNWTPYQFVEFICDMHKCKPDIEVNRIHFKKHKES